MATVLIPLPRRDFDPSEAAVSWRLLRERGHRITFATPDGQPASADELMLTGRGLDPWGWIPFLKRFPLLGLILRANADARAAHAKMAADAAFRAPRKWEEIRSGDFDALLLPGGHRARGMTEYLESPALQLTVADFFDADRPVAAICHGVLLAARSRSARTGKSALCGRRTTALTWALERSGWLAGRIGRFWDPGYYRTYLETPSQPAGYMSVQAEVTRALRSPEDFLDVPPDAPHRRLMTSGTHRDSASDDRPAFVVRDGCYVSARWPGDVHTFAQAFADLLAEGSRAIP